MTVQSPEAVVSMGDLILQGRLGDARDVPLMSHLTQPNAPFGNSPWASAPLDNEAGLGGWLAKS